MKNGATLKMIWGSLVALVMVACFLFGGWRTEMGHANTAVAALRGADANHEARLQVLEDRWTRITDDLGEIKRAVKEE